jgi:hypothetical protein
MGFGEKTDLATGRKLNLDKTYKNIIKPAVVAAGYDCIRADEIQHSGVIDIPMYRSLFDADLVVADLSTANLNAVFELGVRYGLKPRATIIIAESGFQSPFDVNHILIRKYEHLGVDIGIDEGERMRKVLTDIATAIKNSQDIDSPVYSMLANLLPPNFREEQLVGAAAEGQHEQRGARRPEAHLGESNALPPPDPEAFGVLIDFALKESREGRFDAAKPILQRIYDEQTAGKDPDGASKRARPRVVQQLALATYKLGDKNPNPNLQLSSYAEAIELLKTLDPEQTTDPETLGLWSAIHKRRAEIPARTDADRRADLDIAITAAERGFLIRQDHYTGGNLAYLLDVRASISEGADRIADRVLASRVRTKIVAITEARLARLEPSKAAAASKAAEAPIIDDEIYWNNASRIEALVGLGRVSVDEARDHLTLIAPQKWMMETSLGQITKLAKLHLAIDDAK